MLHSILLLSLFNLGTYNASSQGRIFADVDTVRPIKRRHNLDDVIVTGQYTPQSSKNSVFNVRTITAEQIKLRSAVNLVQLLSAESGVRFSNDLTLGTADISLMGISGQGVKILLDGIPLLDRGETRESLSQIDVNTIERIEIVEGPLSVIYGTDALAGVINIITKKAKSDAAFRATLRLQEESVGSEYNTLTKKGIHNQSINVNYNWQRWTFGGSFARNDFGGWRGQSAGRELDWNPKDQLLGGLSAGFKNEKFSIQYRINATDETITAYGNLNANNAIATDKDYITKRYFHQLQSEWAPVSKFTMNTAVAYTDYTRRTKTTLFNGNTGDIRLSPDAGSQDESVFHSAFLRNTGYYKFSEFISVQPGIEINLNEASGDRISGSPKINDYAAFLSAEFKPVRTLNIRPGLRTIYNTVYNAPPLIPSLNVSLALYREFDLRASYATGFRAPTLRELYFDFFDSSHSITGNQNLKAENSNSYNLSMVWESDRQTILRMLSMSTFYNHIKNKIAIAANPDINGVNSYINIGLNKTAGISLQSALRWNDLQANMGFLYIGRYNQYHEGTTSDGGRLPEFTWSPEFNANIIYHIRPYGLSINGVYKFNGRLPIYEIAGTAQEPKLSHTNAYSMADVILTKGWKAISVSAGVRNLLNVTRIQNTSLDVGSAHSTGGPVPVSYGRSYFLGLSYSLATSK